MQTFGRPLVRRWTRFHSFRSLTLVSLRLSTCFEFSPKQYAWFRTIHQGGRGVLEGLTAVVGGDQEQDHRLEL